MKIELTLQEKLSDLRNERKLKLADVSESTGIPVSTLQRIESDEDIRVGYQDVRTLAEFYKVSADYLFGLTDNRTQRNSTIDELRLSDAAIGVLKSKELNNRLVSELLSHPGAPSLFSAMEMYIDRKILPQMNTMNAMYKLTEATIRESFDVSDKDEHLRLLQEAVVDGDEYLLFRITERYSALMKSLFEAHKKDALPDEQAGILQEMSDNLKSYQDKRQTESAERAKLALLAKQLGLNTAKLTDEELRVLIKALQDSDLHKRARRRK